MSDELRARTSAVTAVAHGVTQLARGTEAAATTARNDLNRIGAEFQAALVRSQQQLTQSERMLDQAEAALRACRENCGPLQDAVARCARARDVAQRLHEQNRRAERDFQTASRDLRATLGTAEQAIAENARATRATVLAYAQELNAYLASGGNS